MSHCLNSVTVRLCHRVIASFYDCRDVARLSVRSYYYYSVHSYRGFVRQLRDGHAHQFNAKYQLTRGIRRRGRRTTSLLQRLHALHGLSWTGCRLWSSGSLMNGRSPYCYNTMATRPSALSAAIRTCMKTIDLCYRFVCDATMIDDESTVRIGRSLSATTT